VELGGVGQQVGQPLEVLGRELVKDAGDLGLRRVPQQHHHQLTRLGVALGQPGAAAPSSLLFAELTRVRHRGHLLLLLVVERVKRSRERRRMRVRPLGWWCSS
jgi:hypothetical protein